VIARTSPLTNAYTGDASVSVSARRASPDSGTDNLPVLGKRSRPSSAHLKIPGSSSTRLSVRSWFSPPVERLGDVEDDHAQASAPDASLRLSSSLVAITIRVGNFPVHASRFLRSIVIASSPLIDPDARRRRVRTVNARVRNQREWLADQWLKAEVRRHARQRWRGDVPSYACRLRFGGARSALPVEDASLTPRLPDRRLSHHPPSTRPRLHRL
jgi:hypothetical protein